jgi:hypothetical protein
MVLLLLLQLTMAVSVQVRGHFIMSTMINRFIATLFAWRERFSVWVRRDPFMKIVRRLFIAASTFAEGVGICCCEKITLRHTNLSERAMI